MEKSLMKQPSSKLTKNIDLIYNFYYFDMQSDFYRLYVLPSKFNFYKKKSFRLTQICNGA